MKDYYATLKVKPTAGADEIKVSFRTLAKQCHPDLNPGDKTAEERFKEANEAYVVLGDPEKRRNYDSDLRIRQVSAGFQQGAGFDFSNSYQQRRDVFWSYNKNSGTDFEETLRRTFAEADRHTYDEFFRNYSKFKALE